jgi:predicted RNA-binding Zn-ribbon protein involved in translation (DUF1610 family)
MAHEHEPPCQCDNCGWAGAQGDLDRISDYAERTAPGFMEMPAGQCPECGCLAYFEDEDTREQRRLKDAAADLLAAAKHAAQELVANLYPEEREELHGLAVALQKLNAAIAKATRAD